MVKSNKKSHRKRWGTKPREMKKQIIKYRIRREVEFIIYVRGYIIGFMLLFSLLIVAYLLMHHYLPPRETVKYDTIIWGITGTFSGVVFAFLLERRMEYKILRKRLLLAILMIFHDCELNRLSLFDIITNLRKLIRVTIPRINALPKSADSQVRFLELLSMAQANFRTVHELSGFFINDGYEIFSKTDALITISSDKLRNDITIGYKEFHILRRFLFMTEHQIESIMQSSASLEFKMKQFGTYVLRAMIEARTTVHYFRAMRRTIHLELAIRNIELKMISRKGHSSRPS